MVSFGSENNSFILICSCASGWPLDCGSLDNWNRFYLLLWFPLKLCGWEIAAYFLCISDSPKLCDCDCDWFITPILWWALPTVWGRPVDLHLIYTMCGGLALLLSSVGWLWLYWQICYYYYYYYLYSVLVYVYMYVHFFSSQLGWHVQVLVCLATGP
jgi:hypothetical protein